MYFICFGFFFVFLIHPKRGTILEFLNFILKRNADENVQFDLMKYESDECKRIFFWGGGFGQCLRVPLYHNVLLALYFASRGPPIATGETF